MEILTDEHRKRAVELFAQGYTRQQAVSFLIDQYPELQEHESPKFRRQLADNLKTCDPSASQFAIKKYGSVYDTHRAAFKDTLRSQYETATLQSIQHMQTEVRMLVELREEYEHMVNHATEAEPEGNSEKNATLNTLININKRLGDITEKMLDRFEKVLGINTEAGE